MDSALDSALPATSGPPAALSLRQRWSQVWTWLVWGDTRRRQGRHRRMQLDTLRVSLGTLAAVALTVSATLGWTWHRQQQMADRAAVVALSWLEQQLDTIAGEQQRIAGHADLRGAGFLCSPELVQELLHESLNSRWVRRFEVLSPGQSQRCGPQGERGGEGMQPAAARAAAAGRDAAPAGTRPDRTRVSLALGGQIAARPAVMLVLDNGLTVRATLDPQALTLPHDLWPAGIAVGSMGVYAETAPSGSLLLWGARASQTVPRQRPQAPLGLRARATSSQHPVAVRVEVRAAELHALLWVRAVQAGLAALLAAGIGVLWVWRRAVLQSRLVHRLSHALRKRQFEPFVQPIVDLQTGRCTGAEVLMRWNHPQRGILGPGEFIEEAERTGLILGMSDLTMSLAAHRLATVAQANPGLYFSFNVTPGQLREPGFAQRLAEIFRPDTVPRDQVLLEVTERDFVDPRAKGRLLALRADGWRIAIDDFGTGQSSLASIESLPVDRIKIDRAFVSSIDEKTVNRPVLDTIIQLSRDLRVPLIAEGIETRSQWDYLRARGVANAQGYLMARPMPIAEFLRWLAQHAARAEPTAAEAPDPAAPPALPVQPGTAAQRALWQRMRGQGGLPIRDRVYKLRNYPQCFVGSQAVDWMVAQLGVSRAEALRQGRALVAVGLVQHVLDEHDFNDGDYFYRLAPASAVEGGAAAADASGVAPSGARLQGALDVPWRSHRRGLLRHHRCASGRELVDWIVNHHPITRATARDWAALWMRQGTLRHVFDSQPFRDDQTLYRLG